MRQVHAEVIKTCTDAGVDISRISETYTCIKLEKDGTLNTTKLNTSENCTTFCESGLDASSEQPNAAQKAFWEAFKCHHTDCGTVKFHNSNMTLWCDKSYLAVVETAKLFCSSLGQNAGHKQKFDDFDAEAIFNMIRHCKGFSSTLRSIASDHAMAARNAINHAHHPELDRAGYTKIYSGLMKFVNALDLSSADKDAAKLELTKIHDRDYMLDIDPWQYERMLDDHARCKLLEAELATLEGANQKLQHNLHAQDMGNRKQVLVQSTLSLVMDALLQDSTGARSKLQSTWAAGSRRPLLDQIQRCMHDRGNRCITWVHGSHGRFISGVSSIAQRLLVIYARMDGGK